ncbi:MAG: lamin tail domain-containing protein [Candidatus Fermentibacter sp.]|nr:lamin tail domain-containing protein [Candidatus Fermentibacter sp.]
MSGKGLVLASALAAVFSGAAAADVIINEIMFNPSTALGDDTAFEWVEIHNNGSSSVDISGWTMTDLDTGSGAIFPAGTSIPAGGYRVLARDAASFVGHYGGSVPLIDWTGSWGSGLSNTEDEVLLLDASSAVVDSLMYDDTTAWGSDYGDDNTYADCDGDGASLERLDPADPSTDPGNWDSSIDEASGIPDANWSGHDESHGTPGAVNSISIISLESQTWAGIKTDL